LVNLELSQGGAPCIEYSKQTNVVPDKQKMKLWPDEYYEGCSNEIYGHTTSPFFAEVSGYTQFSEQTLFDQNDDILDEVKLIYPYDWKKLSGYMYTLY